MWYTPCLKLYQFAKQQRISYRTALRWWKAGQIKGYQAETGTIRYKHQTKGRNLMVFERGAVWKGSLTHGEIAVSQLGLIALTRVKREQEDKPRFSGTRSGRWYRVKGRAPIHSDVNGSYNIGRKVFPRAFDGRGIEGTAVRPVRLTGKVSGVAVTS